MKTKLLFIIAFLTTLYFNATAYEVVLIGGGKKGTYHRVHATDTKTTCSGNGHNPCLIKGCVTMERTIFHPLEDVVLFVIDQVNAGNKSGQAKYKNDLPVDWNTNSDGDLQIIIHEKEIIGNEEFEVEG
jgi:hypothetical protein